MWPAAAEGQLEPRLVWLVLVLATVLGAALRVPFLGHQSLWLDEIFTRDILGASSLSGLWHHIQSTESTPPLYYLLAWLFGGRSAVAMRAIPALALIAAVPVSYLAFRRLVGQRVALATAVMLAVSPILVSYSTDARSYGLLVLTALFSVWGLSAVIDAGRPRNYALWTVASIACVWTHYFGAFLIGAEVVVLLAMSPGMRAATLRWFLVIGLCLIPLVPLALNQSGDERAEFIAGIPLGSRVSSTVRQFAMGANVPRTWLEAAGLVLYCLAAATGVWLALRSRRGPRLVLAIAAMVIGTPLLLAAFGIEDRFYARNLVLALPLVTVLAASAMVRIRALPLLAYVVLASVSSLWVATNWRYEQPDWRHALARAESIDPSIPVLAVTKQNAPAVRTYLGRDPASPYGLVARRLWILIEPIRTAGHRALVPAPVPTLPGFSSERAFHVHGFWIILAGARGAAPLASAELPNATLFPPRCVPRAPLDRSSPNSPRSSPEREVRLGGAASTLVPPDNAAGAGTGRQGWRAATDQLASAGRSAAAARCAG